jgi:hypothetical protein
MYILSTPGNARHHADLQLSEDSATLKHAIRSLALTVAAVSTANVYAESHPQMIVCKQDGELMVFTRMEPPGGGWNGVLVDGVAMRSSVSVYTHTIRHHGRLEKHTYPNATAEELRSMSLESQQKTVGFS